MAAPPLIEPTVLNARVREDLAESRLRQDRDFYEDERVFFVDNLPENWPGGGKVQAWDRKYQALNATGIPRLYEPHPGQDLRNFLRCVERKIKSIDQKNYQVRCIYRLPDTFEAEPGTSPKITIGSTLVSARTSQGHIEDPDTGEFRPVELEVLYRPIDAGPEVMPQKRVEQIDYQVPMLNVVYVRRENGSPGDAIKHFNGTVNYRGLFNDPPRTWLAQITAESSDGGATYLVRYEFIRNPDTWDAFLVFKKQNGYIPTDICICRPFGGVARHRVLPETEFRDLGLNIFGPVVPEPPQCPMPDPMEFCPTEPDSSPDDG